MNQFYLFDSYFIIRKGFPSADGEILVPLHGLVSNINDFKLQGQQPGIIEFKR